MVIIEQNPSPKPCCVIVAEKPSDPYNPPRTYWDSFEKPKSLHKARALLSRLNQYASPGWQLVPIYDGIRYIQAEPPFKDMTGGEEKHFKLVLRQHQHGNSVDPQLRDAGTSFPVAGYLIK